MAKKGKINTSVQIHTTIGKKSFKKICQNTKCNAELEEEDVFCTECGTKFDGLSVELRKIIKQAESGDVAKMSELAMCYLKGNVVELNQEKAFEWAKRASSKNDSLGLYIVGYCYYYGYGVKKVYTQAFFYLLKSAELGNIDAQYLVAICYYNGQGTSKSLTQARLWIAKACEGGHKGAKKIIDRVNTPIKSKRKRSSRSSYYYDDDDDDDESGGCYITTATCKEYGKTDDCYELTSFRHFRDNWLACQPDGQRLIQRYYQTAPSIVDKINNQPNHLNIYAFLRDKFLSPCLSFIENGENEKCKKLYIQMMNYLEKEKEYWK